MYYRSRRHARFLRRQRLRVGRTPKRGGYSKIKDHTIVNGFSNLNTNVLDGKEITQIPRVRVTSGGTQDIDDTVREGNLILIKGVSIKGIFGNNYTAGGGGPLFVNIAVIGARTADSTVNVDSDFFRRPGYSTRYADFTSTSLTGLDRAKLPINTDKYVVLHHSRFSLGTKGSGWSNDSVYKSINKYIPINRQIGYRNHEATSAEARIWVIYWCGGWNQGAGALNQVDGMLRSVDVKTYFRDTN